MHLCNIPWITAIQCLADPHTGSLLNGWSVSIVFSRQITRIPRGGGKRADFCANGFLSKCGPCCPVENQPSRILWHSVDENWTTAWYQQHLDRVWWLVQFTYPVFGYEFILNFCGSHTIFTSPWLQVNLQKFVPKLSNRSHD